MSLGIWRSNLLLVRMCFPCLPPRSLTYSSLWGWEASVWILGCFVRFWGASSIPSVSLLLLLLSLYLEAFVQGSHNCLGHNYFFCRQALKLLVFITLDWMWSFPSNNCPFSLFRGWGAVLKSVFHTIHDGSVSGGACFQFWPLCFFTLRYRVIPPPLWFALPCKSHQKEDDTLVLSPTITADNTKVVCFKFEFLISFEGDTGFGGHRLWGLLWILWCKIGGDSWHF